MAVIPSPPITFNVGLIVDVPVWVIPVPAVTLVTVPYEKSVTNVYISPPVARLVPPSLTAAVLAATVGLASVPAIVIVSALPVVTESTSPLSIPAT